MGTVETRRQNILEDLHKMDFCTYEFLQGKYHIKERSMQADIKALINQGYKIKGKKALKGYFLDKESAPDSYYVASGKETIRRLYITLILQKSSGMTKRQLAKELSMYYSTDKLIDLRSKAGQNESGTPAVTGDSKTLATDLEVLMKEHLITESAPGVYCVSEFSPIQLTLTNDDAIAILNSIDLYGPGHHFQSILADIRSKLVLALFNDVENDFRANDNYMVYNKSFLTSAKLDELLKRLESYPYETKALHITYKIKNNNTKTVDFNVGNVMYSVDKDVLYLLGETLDGTKTIINCSSIMEISVLDHANSIYHNEFFTRIISTMFSISLDKPEHVLVRFDNINQIRSKLERVISNRPKTASLKAEGDHLIYEDTISGIADFANYLRRYGRSCIAIEPESLVELMRNSAKRTLENYSKYCS